MFAASDTPSRFAPSHNELPDDENVQLTPPSIVKKILPLEPTATAFTPFLVLTLYKAIF